MFRISTLFRQCVKVAANSNCGSIKSVLSICRTLLFLAVVNNAGFATAALLVVTSAGVERFDENNGSGSLLVPVGGATGVAHGPEGLLYVNTAFSTLRFDTATGSFVDVFVPFAFPFPFRLFYQGSFGPDGKYYVSDVFGQDIKRFDPTTGSAQGSLVLPGGGGLREPVSFTWAVGDTRVLVADDIGGSILEFDAATASFLRVLVAGSSVTSGIGQIVVGPDGNLYVASFTNNNVLRFNPTSGAFIDVFASGGDLSGPFAMAFGPDENLYVASTGNDEIMVYDGTSGSLVRSFGTVGDLQYAQFITFIPTNALNVSEPLQHTLFLAGFILLTGFRLHQKKLARASRTITTGR